jgi:AcrR family transcriptional regulator
MPRPKQRTPELRDQVLRTAVDMLSTDGVAAFTTRRVAEGAATSVPAVYELFGDKAGLVREIFFEGFRSLRHRMESIGSSSDPILDVLRIVAVFREFVRENPVLTEVMFARPFTDFDPRPEDISASGSLREFIVSHVQRCIDAGALRGDAVDISHVLLALAQGLAAQETAGWLGRSPESRDRRWSVAFEAVLGGFR